MLDDVDGRGIMPSPSLAEQELGQSIVSIYTIGEQVEGIFLF